MGSPVPVLLISEDSMSQDQALPLKLVLALVPAWFWLCLHLSKALALFWLLFGLMSGIDSLLLRLSFSTSSLSGNRNQEQMAVRRKETKEDGQSHRCI